VVAFALVSEMLSPKRFAGLFSAAPAVAIAGLAVVLLDKGHREAHDAAVGMIAGAAGMVLYASLAVPLLARQPAPRASFVALAGWLAVAAVGLIPVLLA
jgi:hypothetical protein